MHPSSPETFYPKTRQEWRRWLKKNHATKQSIWLVCYKKQANVPTVGWSELVDEAICFGWIDSTRRSLGDDRYIQFFCPRKPKSNWSKINKDKVKRLQKEGLMMPAGLESIEIAKKNGSWNFSDEIEGLKIPADLDKEFRSRPGSKNYFLSLSKTIKKGMLHWVAHAKRPETRQKRILEISELAAQKKKPKQF